MTSPSRYRREAAIELTGLAVHVAKTLGMPLGDFLGSPRCADMYRRVIGAMELAGPTVGPWDEDTPPMSFAEQQEINEAEVEQLAEDAARARLQQHADQRFGQQGSERATVPAPRPSSGTWPQFAAVPPPIPEAARRTKGSKP